MFNLSEILTLIIGILLAIIFLDGLRRALRSRRNSIMVDLSSYPNEEFEDLNNDPISNDLYEAKNSEVLSSELGWFSGSVSATHSTAANERVAETT